MRLGMLRPVKQSQFGSGTRVLRMPLVVVETRDVEALALEQIHAADGRALGKPLIWFQSAGQSASESAEAVLLADGNDGRWGAARAAELSESGFFGLIVVAAHAAAKSVVVPCRL